MPPLWERGSVLWVSMSPEKKVRIVFASAVALLVITGLVAASLITDLIDSESGVRHSYVVEIELGHIESALAAAGRSRVSFANTGDQGFLQDVDSARREVQSRLEELRSLTSDNPAQQVLWTRLSQLANERLEIVQRGVELAQTGKADPAMEVKITAETANAAFGTAATSDQMMRNEERLVVGKSRISSRLLTTFIVVLFVTFGLSVLLFWIHYRLLNSEVHQRRYLSARLLRLQDEERRRFARELHDSLGQNLVAAKITLSRISGKYPQDTDLPVVVGLIDGSLQETRTLSHLLHPPLLDEIGFSSAANWLIDGFAQSTGIKLSAQISEDGGRLPRTVEIALFRTLQESLTNIHRHSGSERAEIFFERRGGQAVLTIRDFGKGFSRTVLERLRFRGSQTGIGLAGMRERIREQGGTLEISSDPSGTLIKASIPVDRVAKGLSASPQIEEA
jgi:signal transduction histidine kinase